MTGWRCRTARDGLHRSSIGSTSPSTGANVPRPSLDPVLLSTTDVEGARHTVDALENDARCHGFVTPPLNDGEHMEIFGDLGAHSLRPSIRTESWSRSSPSRPRRRAGLRGQAASMGSRRSTPPARDHAGLLIAIAILGPLGWYLGSPLVLSRTIDEPSPLAAAASPTPSIAPATPEPAATPSPTERASPAAPLRERSGSFSGADEFISGNGTARLIETAPGVFTVRLEDFAVRNGPDLFVYLSPSADGYADGAIELGSLKADRGNQNYEVPAGTDLSSTGSVVIWCKQFAVLFATAPLD